jgi:hypothetical protein
MLDASHVTSFTLQILLPNNSTSMSSIGPDLPPHLLEKRKRQADEDAEAAQNATKYAPVKLHSPEGGEKRRRVVGPATPPVALGERPQASIRDDEDSSSSDDDYGPSIPTEETSAVRI